VLGLALVRQPRRSMSWVLGLLLFVGYYTLFRFDRMVGQGTLSPFVVAWTPNVVAMIVAMMISASSRPSALER
jgi:lipopolysaccharide export LptBFGC system permease protein LptF